MRYKFLLTGYVIPYVRMTTRSKWTERAQNYIASQASSALQMKTVMTLNGWEMFPKDVPLGVMIYFHVIKGLRKSDLDNKVKAILDSMKGIVYHDDNQVDYG